MTEVKTETKAKQPKKQKEPNTDLKFSTIKQKARKSHTKEKYELEDGSTITFYPTFPPTLIDKMFEEIQTIFQEKDAEIELSNDLFQKYILFMCVKHFTHLKSQLKATTFIDQLNEMESIMDTRVNNDTIDLFTLIVEELFLSKELQYIFDKTAKIIGGSLFMDKMEQKVQNEFAKLEFKNKEIFENMSLSKPETNNVSNVLANK